MLRGGRRALIALAGNTISFVAWLSFVLTTSWPALVDPKANPGSQDQFSLSGLATVYSLPLVMAFLVAVLALSVAVGAGRRTSVVLGALFVVASIGWDAVVFQIAPESVVLRSPEGNLGFIDPLKLYAVATIPPLLVISLVSLVRVGIAAVKKGRGLWITILPV